MKKRSFLLSLIVVASVSCVTVSSADDTNDARTLTAPNVYFPVLARLFEVFDAAQFDYGEIPSGTDQVWIVGRVVDPRYNVRDSTLIGQVDILAALSGHSITNIINYKLTFNTVNGAGNIIPAFLPFDKAAVCRIRWEGSELSMFRPIYVIPEAWTNSAIGGFREYQRAPQQYQTKKARSLKTIMLTNTENSNPFLAIASFRALSYAGVVDHEFVSNLLSKTSGQLQATFICIALQQPDKQLAGRIVKDLVRTVENTNSLKDLRWIALGARAAMFVEAPPMNERPFPDGKYDLLETNALTILSAVNQKLKQVGIEGETNLFLRAVIYQWGVAPRGR